MTKKFSVVKLSEEKDPITLCNTFSRYEAKNRYKNTTLLHGEKVELRSHLEDNVVVIGERNNGYCA